MKKTYINPSLTLTDLRAEQMLALSVGVKNETSGGSESWSNHKAWSSESFTAQDEENVEE